MYAIALPPDADDAAFRETARPCLAAGLAPGAVTFDVTGAPSLLTPPPPSDAIAPRLSLSRAFAEHMAEVACHSAADRFDLLYALVWRLARGEADPLEQANDPVVLATLQYARAVRRDIHKMHAFLRFREQAIDGRPTFVAWFQPQHYILKRSIPFFVERFGSMDWLIVTPDGSAAWRDGALNFGPGGARPPETNDAVLDGLWLTYYRTIFNPARLHVNAMLREMPKRYWQDMPETRLVPDMLRTANARAGAMDALPADDAPKFAERVAERRALQIAQEAEVSKAAAGTLAEVRQEADGCTRCPLHRPATQMVFGEGPPRARLMFVGEQPGDQEDLAGKPFIGPAGQKFNAALEDAGIDRRSAYVTNAVKHFKFEPRGKRRIHSKPNGGEIQACNWWLKREIALVQPDLIVALGATAALALAGHAMPVMNSRGRIMAFGAHRGLVTIHPSFLLRLPDPEAAARAYQAFVADLKLAARTLDELEAA